MRNLIFLLLLSLSIVFISSFTTENKTFKAELISIKHYSVSKCQNSNVYTMVLYKVNHKDVYSLKMRHEFSNGITTSSPVTETNKRGYVVYSFCNSKIKNKEFTTIFISQDGKISNPIKVKTNPSSEEIINGTSPKTIIQN